MTIRAAWINAALVAVSVVFASLVAELGVRAFLPNQVRDSEFTFYQYDAALGWTNRPNAGGPFRVPGVTTRVAISSQGWRDREFPLSTPGKTRIVVLGDSQTWGYGVEAHERYSDELQRRRPDAEVLNMGVTGYGTAQEFLLLQQTLETYRPDVVIVGFFENDLIDNVNDGNNDPSAYPRPILTLSGGTLTLANVPVPRRPQSWQHAPMPTDDYPGPIRWLWLHSRLFQTVGRPAKTSLENLQVRLGWKSEIGPKDTGRESPPWRVTFAIFDAMKTYLDSRGVTLIVAVVPAKYNVAKRITYVEDNMRWWSAERGVTVVTAADQFVQAGAGRLFLRYDGHLSPAGHAMLGGLINDALSAK